MTTTELLARLDRLGVRLRVEGDRLRFSAPAGALDEDLRAELSRRKEELLTVLRVAQASHEAAARPIVPVPRGAGGACFPLSFAQQRLWLLEQLEPGTAAYHLAAARRLRGAVKVAAMHRSLDEIVRRHEILCTTFAEVDGLPVQRIAPRPPPALPLVDLGGLVPAEGESEARRLAAAEARRPFDLAAGPLFRMSLLRLREEDHVALVTMHHIVSDGWSVGVFLRELAALYEALSQGRPSPLAPLGVQYADFAHWQRRDLSGAESEAGAGYWRAQLGGSPRSLELPPDRPRPARETFRGSSHSVALSAALQRALAELSRRQEVTPFMILLAAFKVVLSRYSGQEDVVVGSPIAGRKASEIEELIGLFVNNLVLRTDLSGNPSFRRLLSRIRRVALDAYAHQDVPFELLVEELQPQRDLSRNPIFQVMFALDQEVIEKLRLPGLELGPFPCATAAARLDLTVFLWEGAAGITGEVEYNTDLFDASTIARLAGSYLTLLAGVVADPERRLGDLPLLSPAQRHQLHREWNDTGTEPGEGLSLIQLVTAQVERAPAAVAVGCGNRRLSYRELNRRSNQLAHHLIGLGVGPEVLVGVCAERSPEMMVGLLAVLKAGGAYVPLDPSFPRERLAWVLEATGSPDGRAPVVLCHRHLDAALGSYAGRAVFLDADGELLGRQSDDDPGPRGGPENLAYVLFTSGSTGRPKGVPIGRRALVNFLRAMRHRPGLGADDVLVAVTTLSFDIAALELFLPLVAGARVEIASRETAADGMRLSRLLEAVGATAMQATPVTWRLLLEAGWQGGESFAVLCGGEALPGELAPRLAGRGRLWNLYGPTETTIWSTISPVTGRAAPITIGRPIANTWIHLLDRRLGPVPQGASGQLHIGGAGLARGYQGRPALTAERFIPDPFCAESGGRLYRTGDLARTLADGCVQFQGRLDSQVKLRGFRIEPGEIEAILGEHPEVIQGVVIAREDVPGNRYLAAYVVSGGDPTTTASELRHFLKQKLPDYMVPAVFVHLDELPLNNNNKVDRRRLPAPSRTRLEPEGELRPPETPIEEDLADIFAELVGVDEVGRDHDFFDLGGHSLLASQAISRIRETFALELPLRSFFEAPTVAELALVIEKELIAMVKGLDADQLEAPAAAEVPSIRPRVREGHSPFVPLRGNPPLSFAQQRLWFLDQFEPGSPLYNIPGMLDLQGTLDPALLAAALGEIVRRHEVLRTTFAVAGGDEEP
ncbi:MAG: amino acid adenylation domain-containing protein, partial [bacterium]|nr:amino acid adenylation domain-containing protein [bacterium]